ncbi:MAG: HEAT repeat domain-containing protein, partial [bacterium]
LSVFVEAYLNECQKPDLFSNREYFDACGRLSDMVGERESTVLLAKLYVEQIISSKERRAGDKPPQNIPDLMLNYLSEVNDVVQNSKLDDRTVHRIAKAIAWQCLKESYCATPIRR